MNKFIAAFLMFNLFFSFNAIAQDAEKALVTKLLFEAGLSYGGDEILNIQFTNGEDQKMLAGQGGYIAVGGEFQLSKIKKILLRTSIGFKYNTTAAENANIRLTRIPINFVGFGKITDDIRVGLGISAHQNVRLKGDGFVSDIDFTSTIGPRFEIGYKWIALTYTSINYMDEMDEKFSASSFGLSVSFTFPRK